MHDLSQEYKDLGYLSKTGRKSDYVQQDNHINFGCRLPAKKLPFKKLDRISPRDTNGEKDDDSIR